MKQDQKNSDNRGEGRRHSGGGFGGNKRWGGGGRNSW